MGPAPSSVASPPPPSKPANHMAFSGGPGAARLVPSSSSPSSSAQIRSPPPSKNLPPPSPPPGAASRAEMLVSPESMDSASAGGYSVRHTKMREVLGEASVDMQALQVPASLRLCANRVQTLAAEACVERHTAQLPQQRVEDHAGKPFLARQLEICFIFDPFAGLHARTGAAARGDGACRCATDEL